MERWTVPMHTHVDGNVLLIDTLCIEAQGSRNALSMHRDQFVGLHRFQRTRNQNLCNLYGHCTKSLLDVVHANSQS